MAADINKVEALIAAKVSGTEAVDKLNKSLRDTASSTDNLSRQQQRFLSSLQGQVKYLEEGSAGLAKMRAEQLGVANQAAPLVDKLKKLTSEGGHGFEELSLKTAGARRELLVLGHEMLQGNWTRFGGSLMVLGERTNAASLAFSGMGLAVLGVVGAIGAFITAAVKGAIESDHFEKTMRLTNGAAGITEGELNSLAHTMSRTLPGGVGTAREALMQLAASGQFSGEVLKQFGRDAMIISNLTGQNAEEVVKDFDRMKEGVAKWASEHNRQYHFLTLAQYEHIKALEQEGHQEQAMIEVAKALEKSMKDQRTNLGFLEKAWKGVALAVGDAWDAMKSIGREKTIDDKIKDINDKIAKLGHVDTKNMSSDGVRYYEQLMDERFNLYREKAKQELSARMKAEQDANNQLAIVAKDRVDKLREETNEQYRLNKELKDYRRDIEALAKAGSPVSKAQQALDEAAIRKKYDHIGTHAENMGERRLLSLQDERVALEQEIEQWKKYGEAVNKSRVELLKWDIQHGKLKDASKATLAAAMAEAQRVDAEQAKLAAVKSETEIQKKIDSVTAQAKALGIDLLFPVNKAVTQEAILMKDLEQARARLSPETYERLAKQIHDASALLEERKLGNAMALEQGRITDEINKLKAETEQLGLSNVERQKAIALIRLEAEARKLREMYPGHDDQINAARDAQGIALTNAIQAQYDTSRSADVGVRSAFSSYIENATDAAKQVQKIWTDAFKGTEDILMKFLEGGKVNFRAFANSIIQDILRMELEQSIMAPLVKALGTLGGGSLGSGLFGGAVSSIKSLFGFANGGIMSSAGPLPLMAYSSGGIADRPQLALFGEGRMNEAYVPLPDGRSIPVSMKGASRGAGHTFNTNVVVNSDGTATVSGQQQGQGFARAIRAAIQAELVNQRRDGGLLSQSPIGA